MWKITKVNVSSEVFKSGIGTKSCDFDEETFKKLPHYEFRMLDGDGIVPYYGISTNNNTQEAFEPLDDFGAPNAGCTDIQYKNDLGEWENLSGEEE